MNLFEMNLSENEITTLSRIVMNRDANDQTILMGVTFKVALERDGIYISTGRWIVRETEKGFKATGDLEGMHRDLMMVAMATL